MPPATNAAEAANPLRDAPIACHELDVKGNVIWVNPAGCRLFGLPEDQIVGRPVWEFVAPEEREESRAAVARKLASECQLGNFERKYTRPDGSVRFLEIYEHYRRTPEGQIAGMRSFLLDVTGRKQAQEALRRAQEELESRILERTHELELAIEFLHRESEEKQLAEKEHRRLEAQVQYAQRLESMGVLAGGVAHKFNNLLTSIMGYATMAGMELPEGSRVREHIDQVLAAAKSAADLTQQMLAYSGRGQFVLEALDLSEVVDGTAQLLESLVSQKGVLTFDLSPGLPRIEADPGQLRQILVNLISNASDALSDRNGEIHVRTGMLWVDDGELPPLQQNRIVPAGFYTYLEVADTGAGMDTQTLGRVFDPFFTTKFTGRGLGLPAVLGIVRAHHGSIRINSAMGQGTNVRIYFPALEEGAKPTAPLPSGAHVWSRSGAVLVVDDEETLRRLAKTVLETAGMEVLTARDGNEALTIFREHADQIHAVLLDLTMPGMDGAEVFRHIHEIRPEVRVVLCSGYNEHEVTERLRGRRPAGFLCKPYQPRDLLNLLDTLW